MLKFNFFKTLIEKLTSLLTASNIININIDTLKLFAKVLNLKIVKKYLTAEISIGLIDKILVSFEGLLVKENASTNQDTDDEENFFQSTQQTQKKTDTAISQAILIGSMSNLNKFQLSNYFYVGRILLALVGISSGGNQPEKSSQCEEIDFLFLSNEQSKRSLADGINLFYDQTSKLL